MARKGMTGRELRDLLAIWPTRRVRDHLAHTRRKVREPGNPAVNGYLSSGPNRPFFWMCIGVMKAELRRRASRGRFQPLKTDLTPL